jgi:hypothetical protein
VRAEVTGRLRDAAERAVGIPLRYAERGTGLAQAALAGAHACVELRHYPARDAIDPGTGTQFYYHAHGSRRRPRDEHGHFHVFAREPGEPGFVHVAALSIDARGLPLRWFATNRWVTGERWADSARVTALLPGLRPRARGRLAPVADWLDAMLVLHARPIAALLARRDAAIARHAARRDLETVLEDRSIDVVAEIPVDLPDRLRELGLLAGDRPALH